MKVFKDVIHGYIQISDLALSLIDKPEFQRLRQLKQLGVAHYVFPTANHTRFEHSIGTYHLAKTLLTQIKDRQPELNVSNRLIELVSVGALLHDIGHVCFSHLFDHCLANEMQVQHHEERSVELIRMMASKYPDIALEKDEVDLICSIILGRRPQNSEFSPFIFEIVANSQFQLDVDKCDYLVRDAFYIGINSPLQVDRIFSFARVIDGHICYHKKVYLQIMDVFMTRYRLHKEVYRHHAVVGIELQVVEILKVLCELQDWKRLFENGNWVWITDSVLDMVPMLEEDGSELVRKVKTLFEDLQKRKFYKRVGNSNGESSLDVKIVKSVMGFSSSSSNPLDLILFYGADFVPTTIKSGEISKLLSNTCVEVEEDMFCRD